MRIYLAARNWLIRKLAGKSTIVINAEISNEPLLYIPHWRKGSLIYHSTFTFNPREKKHGILRRFWNWLW